MLMMFWYTPSVHPRLLAIENYQPELTPINFCFSPHLFSYGIPFPPFVVNSINIDQFCNNLNICALCITNDFDFCTV